MIKVLALLLATAVAATASCETDSDCPSSYCQNGPSKTAPYTCHLCGDACCLEDSDCDGSYCVNDPTKTPPYFCHNTAATPFELLVQKATAVNKAKKILTAKAPAPSAPVNPLTPAAAKDAKIVEDFLKKYQQAVAGAAILIGFIFAFAGYKYFNATLFLCGAAAAGFVSFVLIDYYQPNSDASKPTVVLAVTISLSLFVGILCVYLRKIGTFLAGAAGGASAAIMLNSSILNKLQAPTQVPGLYLYLSLLILGLIGGLLALKVERIVIILSTSLAGSLATVAGVGHFAGHFPTTASSFINPATHEVTHDPIVWAYVGAFVAMVLVSTVVQFKTTSDRDQVKKEEKYRNSLLYAAPETQSKTVYVDHVSGYNTSV
jgi:hypothetical protein